MSSLQKFHRRTNGKAGSPFTSLGGGDNIIGYWMGTDGIGTSKLIVAPKSTEFNATVAWGSSGTFRGTTSGTDGLANTNTLAGFGQAAHPAAYACKNLTTGGYNTWYLPANNEVVTLRSNKALTPFATNNTYSGTYYWSSTELSATTAQQYNMNTTGGNGSTKSSSGGTYGNARAVRRSI
jgi:hypothetical protein